MFNKSFVNSEQEVQMILVVSVFGVTSMCRSGKDLKSVFYF